MDYNTSLQINNADLSSANADHTANQTSLQAVLATVNTLSDATGGGAVPTCTVVGAEYTESGSVRYNTPDGPKYADWGPRMEIKDVLCNTFLNFRLSNGATVVEGGTLLETNGKALLVGITGTAGGTVVIDLYS